MMNNRYFYIKDIDCTIKVEYATRKEMLELIDEMCKDITGENASMYDYSDEAFYILYKDGTTDYIDSEYDGHKIRRQNIASIVNCNSSTYMVYGNFCLNEYGVADTAFEDEIDSTNIKEVDSEDYTEIESETEPTTPETEQATAETETAQVAEQAIGMATLNIGKKYFDSAAHRIVWYRGIKTREWCGETIKEYIFEDVCGCLIKHEVNRFDISKWIEEIQDEEPVQEANTESGTVLDKSDWGGKIARLKAVVSYFKSHNMHWEANKAYKHNWKFYREHTAEECIRIISKECNPNPKAHTALQEGLNPTKVFYKGEWRVLVLFLPIKGGHDFADRCEIRALPENSYEDIATSLEKGKHGFSEWFLYDPETTSKRLKRYQEAAMKKFTEKTGIQV